MSEDGGKYDELAGQLLDAMRAEGIVLLVVNGAVGSGLSLQAEPQHLEGIAEVLEQTAEAIRADAKDPEKLAANTKEVLLTRRNSSQEG